MAAALVQAAAGRRRCAPALGLGKASFVKPATAFTRPGALHTCTLHCLPPRRAQPRQPRQPRPEFFEFFAHESPVSRTPNLHAQSPTGLQRCCLASTAMRSAPSLSSRESISSWTPGPHPPLKVRASQGCALPRRAQRSCGTGALPSSVKHKMFCMRRPGGNLSG